jgi:hypothetical protein
MVFLHKFPGFAGRIFTMTVGSAESTSACKDVMQDGS